MYSIHPILVYHVCLFTHQVDTPLETFINIPGSVASYLNDLGSTKLALAIDSAKEEGFVNRGMIISHSVE